MNATAFRKQLATGQGETIRERLRSLGLRVVGLGMDNGDDRRLSTRLRDDRRLETRLRQLRDEFHAVRA